MTLLVEVLDPIQADNSSSQPLSQDVLAIEGSYSYAFPAVLSLINISHGGWTLAHNSPSAAENPPRSSVPRQ
jgi:hypothetical protein